MLITIRGSLTYIDTKLNIPNSTSSISRSKIKWDWLWTDSVEPNTCINQLLKLLVFLYLLCHYMLNTFYGLGGHSPWGDHSVQFSSVTQLCPTLCNPMDCSTPGLVVHHKLPELAQTHVHRVSDAIQPSSSSVVPFYSHLQFSPASGSFPVSWFFA